MSLSNPIPNIPIFFLLSALSLILSLYLSPSFPLPFQTMEHRTYYNYTLIHILPSRYSSIPYSVQLHSSLFIPSPIPLHHNKSTLI